LRFDWKKFQQDQLELASQVATIKCFKFADSSLERPQYPIQLSVKAPLPLSRGLDKLKVVTSIVLFRKAPKTPIGSEELEKPQANLVHSI
jgi:hypothetical protein